jgi:hypothetical protein
MTFSARSFICIANASYAFITSANVKCGNKLFRLHFLMRKFSNEGDEDDRRLNPCLRCAGDRAYSHLLVSCLVDPTSNYLAGFA